jgi:glucose/arabinose dehydrogenase
MSRHAGLAWIRAFGAITLIGLASPACAPAARLDLKLVADGLERPVDLVAAPGDVRLYIVEQRGRIRVLENGRLRKEPFLDIATRLSHDNEQGLLSVAFHPRYATNGLLFVNYTDRDGNTNVVRYRVTPDRRFADPASATRILFVKQPFANHNGGHLMFGPDSMLYIPLGDGGAGGDPSGNGQNLQTLLGKLLRIDIDHGSPYAIPRDNPFASGRGGRPEIWAYGLRNPWRIAFDSGLLYIGDVGQNQWEEVDVAPARQAGINYGWNLYEGTHPYNASRSWPREAPSGFAHRAPAIDYSHHDGCCVIGGRVYRGSVPALRGLYFFADECRSWIESFRWRGDRATERTRWQTGLSLHPSAFGEDARGELYLLDLGGKIYRIAGAR